MLILLAGTAMAQEPQPLVSPAATLTEGIVSKTHNPWSADLILGLPTAVRLQCRHPEMPLWFETGIGVYVIIPTAFAGVRGEGRFIETKHHDVSVRPGLDVYYFQGFQSHGSGGSWSFGERDVPTFGAVTLDFDLQWRARWCDRFHGLAGIKIGCGGAFGNHIAAPLPIVGITLGGCF